MANTKSAIKRIRRISKQTAVNKARKSRYKNALKKMNSLIENKKKPALVKKYYKNQLDEQNQIRSSLDCMILNKSRIKAIEEAENKKFDLIVLDDGYQDLSFKKDMNIICFSSNQSIGNGFVIPSGPLRENLNTLKKADVALINGEKNIGQ